MTHRPFPLHVRTLSLVLVVSTVSCGGGGDGDSDGSGSLQSALDGARKSLAEVCDKARACYPDIQDEDGFCSVPDEGGTLSFQGDWPEVEADSCWEPLYKDHSAATLDFLSCLSEASKEYEDCLSSCPEDTADCNAKNDETEDDCEEAFVDVVGESALEDWELCERSKLPDDEDEEL